MNFLSKLQTTAAVPTMQLVILTGEANAMKVAIYARVSTTNHNQDVGLQTAEQHQIR